MIVGEALALETVRDDIAERLHEILAVAYSEAKPVLVQAIEEIERLRDCVREADRLYATTKNWKGTGVTHDVYAVLRERLPETLPERPEFRERASGVRS